MAKPIYKVLMCGARDWENRRPIERELRKLIKRHGKNKLVIIEGKAPGADTLAGIVAVDNNIHVCEVGPLWNTRHSGAGPQRNSIMLALQPDEVIAFHSDLTRSTGTKDTVTKARKLRIKTKVVDK